MLRIFSKILVPLIMTVILISLWHFYSSNTLAATENTNSRRPWLSGGCTTAKWYVSYGGVTDWQPLNSSSIPIDQLAFGDFDGDETTDVFSTIAIADKWAYSSGGNGPWIPLATSAIELPDLAFGDFDGDGTTDVFSTIAVADKWAYSSGGNGPWIPLATSAIELPDLAFGDFDGDGTTDVFSSKAIAGKWAYSSGGNTAWIPLATSGVPVDRLKVGHFDEGSYSDIFVSWSTGWWFSSGANHSWQFLRDSDVRLSQIGVGDFNGDGITDIFTSRGASYQPSRTIDLTVSIWRPVSGADQVLYEEIFEYFADGIYEMSNGAHAIGTITVYQNGENANTADVLWQESQWPRTDFAGINNTSIPVIMGDEFPFPTPYDALASGNRIGSGYALAHEWGHYYYAMGDEYRASSADYDDIPSVPHSDDEPTPFSVMNYQWAATSGGDALSWLNFSIRENNMIDGRLRRTAHNRIYGASAWETLIRHPSYDPPTARFINRPFYSELQTVSPIDNLDAHIELPGCQARARSELNIVWETPGSALAFAQQGGSSFTYLPSVEIYPSQTPEYPEPVRVMARVLVPSEASTITKANVIAELITPSNDTIEFPLNDDGISPDAKAFDGLYTGYAPYSENGDYVVNVSFDNNDGLAELTTDGFNSTTSPEGDTYSSTNVLVGENFDVSASNTFTMTNYADDDHGNVLEDATVILDNNIEEPGRIDYAGDSDWFQVDLGDSFGLGEVSALVIRITDMAFGMEPKISVYDEQGSFIHSQSFTGLTNNTNQYPLVLIEVLVAESYVFVEINHADSTSEEGNYSISVGTPLDYERPYSLYLPIIVASQ